MKEKNLKASLNFILLTILILCFSQNAFAQRLFGVSDTDIVELNPTNGSIVNRIPAPAPVETATGIDPNGLAFDGTNLFWTNAFGTDEIFVLNPSNGAIVRSFPVPLGAQIDGLAFLRTPQGPRLYALNGAGATEIIYVLDPLGGNVINSFLVPPGAGGLDGEGNRLFMGDFINGQVHELDPSTGVIIRTFNVGQQGIFPTGVAFDGVDLFLSNSSDERIFVLDPNTGSLLGFFTSQAGSLDALAAGGAAALIPSSLSDLTVTISGPPSASPGQPIGSFTSVSVANKGTAPAAGFFVVLVISKDNIIDSTDILLVGGREFVASLSPGQTLRVPIAANASIPPGAPPGPMFLGVIVDPQNSVPESNKDNNTASVFIRITGASVTTIPPTTSTTPATTSVPVTPVAGLRQWANSATASSEYSPSGWSAMQATAAPNTPNCGDIDTAWAPASSGPNPEWIGLTFVTPVHATMLRVHETFNAGFIFQVDFRDTLGNLHTVWTGTDTTPCPGWFEINIPRTPFLVKGVKINTRIPGWEEIDAVELIGEPDTITPTPTTIFPATTTAPPTATTTSIPGPTTIPSLPFPFPTTTTTAPEVPEVIEITPPPAFAIAPNIVQAGFGFTRLTLSAASGGEATLSATIIGGEGDLRVEAFITTTGIFGEPIVQSIGILKKERESFYGFKLSGIPPGAVPVGEIPLPGISIEVRDAKGRRDKWPIVVVGGEGTGVPSGQIKAPVINLTRAQSPVPIVFQAGFGISHLILSPALGGTFTLQATVFGGQGALNVQAFFETVDVFGKKVASKLGDLRDEDGNGVYELKMPVPPGVLKIGEVPIPGLKITATDGTGQTDTWPNLAIWR